METVGRGSKLVEVEAGNQLKWIAEALKKVDEVRVHVVHPHEVQWTTESYGKTDRVDAKKLTELARPGLLPVHGLRELVSAPQQLKSKRVALINTIRGYVYQEGAPVAGEVFYEVDLGREAGPTAGERSAQADPRRS